LGPPEYLFRAHPFRAERLFSDRELAGSEGRWRGVFGWRCGVDVDKPCAGLPRIDSTLSLRYNGCPLVIY